jgi:hypothetical protein
VDKVTDCHAKGLEFNSRLGKTFSQLFALNQVDLFKGEIFIRIGNYLDFSKDRLDFS